MRRLSLLCPALPPPLPSPKPFSLPSSPCPLPRLPGPLPPSCPRLVLTCPRPRPSLTWDLEEPGLGPWGTRVGARAVPTPVGWPADRLLFVCPAAAPAGGGPGKEREGQVGLGLLGVQEQLGRGEGVGQVAGTPQAGQGGRRHSPETMLPRLSSPAPPPHCPVRVAGEGPPGLCLPPGNAAPSCQIDGCWDSLWGVQAPSCRRAPLGLQWGSRGSPHT